MQLLQRCFRRNRRRRRIIARNRRIIPRHWRMTPHRRRRRIALISRVCSRPRRIFPQGSIRWKWRQHWGLRRLRRNGLWSLPRMRRNHLRYSHRWPPYRWHLATLPSRRNILPSCSLPRALIPTIVAPGLRLLVRLIFNPQGRTVFILPLRVFNR